MSVSEKAIAEREVGQIDVSIGTSLALEGAFGIYPEAEVDRPPLLNYNELWINLSTLFRNLFHSLGTEEKDSVLATDLAMVIAEETTLIQAAVENAVGKKVKAIFYFNDMSQLHKFLPKANIKHPTTPKQRIYTALHDQTLREVQQYLSMDDVDFRPFSVKIHGSGRALMLTHSPIDLLSQYSFASLNLLESHTGKIKPKSQWGSKLGLSEDMALPLNGFTIQVFGDGNTYLSPMSIKYKRAVLNVAKRDRWSPITTMSKIKMGLETISDVSLREELLERYRHQSFST